MWSVNRSRQVTPIVLAAWLLGQPAHAEEAASEVVGRWPLPALGVNRPFDGESITYRGVDELLVSDSNQESIWSISSKTGAITPWLEAPDFGMRPAAIRYEPKDRILFVLSAAGPTVKSGPLVTQYAILGDDGSLLDRWRLTDTPESLGTGNEARDTAVSPDQLMSWLIASPPSPAGDFDVRISAVSRSGIRRLGSRCAEQRYGNLAADAANRRYFVRDHGHFVLTRFRNDRGFRVDRTDADCRQPEVFLEYDGHQPYWLGTTPTAGWPSADRIFVANQQIASAYDTAAERLYSSFVPQICLWCEMVELAARADNGFAVLARNDGGNPPDGKSRRLSTHIAQFDDSGTPTVRTIFRDPAGSVLWAAGRLSVDATGLIHVLYPDSDMVASFASDGALQHTFAVASWASDLDASGRQLAIKGSSGHAGDIQLLDANGRTQWQARCECDESAAIAFAGNQIVTGNALESSLQSFRREDGAVDAWLSRPRASPMLMLDAAASDTDLYVLNGSTMQIEVFRVGDIATGPQRSVATPDDTFRIDAAPNGRLAALTRSGRLVVTEADGAVGESLDLSAIAGGAAGERMDARDVSWSPSGDLYVLDARQPSVLLLQLARLPGPATPAPAAVSDPPDDCRVAGDKRAAPERVAVNEGVTVTLHLAIDCRPAPRPPLDVLIVVDQTSMVGGDGTEARSYYAAMLQAAERLAGSLDLGRDRVAVYQLWYGQLADWTTNLADLRTAIRRTGPRPNDFLPADLESFRGLDWAVRLMAGDARPGADRLLVQIGHMGFMLQRHERDLLARTRQAGVRLILVYRSDRFALPADYAPLRAMVEAPEDLVNLDEALTSDALLQRVLIPYSRSRVRDIEIWDTAGPDVRLVAGSPVPAAQETTDTTIWRSAGVPSTGLTMTLVVRPVRSGRLPTNTRAIAYYTDPSGVRRQFVFPVPYIDVVAPTPTATPSPAPTTTHTPQPTSTTDPTSVPVPIFLPLSVREACVHHQRRIDAVLVLDASTSMLERTPIGRTKLDAAVSAIHVFLDNLTLERDQAALITFSAAANVAAPLTSDRSVLERALAGVHTAPQTCLVCGLEAGLSELQTARHSPDHAAVIVLLTDGRSNPRPSGDAVALAATIRNAGVTIFTIGLGTDVDTQALSEIASRSANFYQAPDAEALSEIYRQIAETIPCPASAFWGGR